MGTKRIYVTYYNVAFPNGIASFKKIFFGGGSGISIAYYSYFVTHVTVMNTSRAIQEFYVYSVCKTRERGAISRILPPLGRGRLLGLGETIKKNLLVPSWRVVSQPIMQISQSSSTTSLLLRACRGPRGQEI